MKKYERHYTTKQRRSYDCGITCAINILRYWGHNVSRSDFEEILADKVIKRDGASMYDLIHVLRKYNLPAQGVSCELTMFQDIQYCPAILVVETMPKKFHYIVLHEIKDGMITVADPSIWAARISVLSFQEFAKKYHWYGETILLKQT